MEDLFKVVKNINLFDVIIIFLMTYFCFYNVLKGFTLSFISFMKWVFALVVTIVWFPKLQPCKQLYWI